MADDASPWEKERLAALLDAAKIAISRSRYVFAAVNVSTIVMLSAEYNGSILWLRNALARAIDRKDPDYTKIYRDIIEKDLGVVSVPLIGIKFSISDITVMGAVGMTILAIWMFYATRRENHVVTKIIQEISLALSNKNSNKASYLYDALGHNFLFLATAKRPNVTIRATVRALFFAPLWVLAVIILAETLSLFVTMNGRMDVKQTFWSGYSPSEHVEVVLRTVFCAIIAVYVFTICRDIDRFQSDTVHQLEDIRNRVEPVIPEAAVTENRATYPDDGW
jgi:hypothetical protein